MKNNLSHHLATKKMFACEASQFHKACQASLWDDITADDFFQLRPKPSITNGVASIHVQEMLTDDVPAAYEKAGYVTRYSTIKGEIEGALKDGAMAIQLHINSGGGSVNGAIELSRYIASLAVPTASIVTSCACSAAYMIAAATNRIVITETAQIGNIGTIMAWVDSSRFEDAIGIEYKAITNEGATLKSTFHLEPNDEQLAFLQDQANQHGETFKAFVRSQRPDINEEVFRAGWYSGNRAVDLGLADEII